MHPWDEPENDDDEREREIECPRCGKAGLTWEHDGERWLLLDHHGEIHHCDPKRIAKTVAVDFDDNSSNHS